MAQEPVLLLLLLLLLLLFILVPCIQAHSFLLSPVADWRSKSRPHCRRGGPPGGNSDDCRGPCIPSTSWFINKAAGITQWKRGQRVDIKWARNNHRNGFVRLTLVPHSQRMSFLAHQRGTFHYACWDGNKRACDSKHMYCGTDVFTYQTTATVPSVRDGRYVLGWTWYGGFGTNGTARYNYADYWSCANVRISGGARSQSARMKPAFVSGHKSAVCSAMTNRIGQCQVEPCDDSDVPDGPRLWRPLGFPQLNRFMNPRWVANAASKKARNLPAPSPKSVPSSDIYRLQKARSAPQQTRSSRQKRPQRPPASPNPSSLSKPRSATKPRGAIKPRSAAKPRSSPKLRGPPIRSRSSRQRPLSKSHKYVKPRSSATSHSQPSRSRSLTQRVSPKLPTSPKPRSSPKWHSSPNPQKRSAPKPMRLRPAPPSRAPRKTASTISLAPRKQRAAMSPAHAPAPTHRSPTKKAAAVPAPRRCRCPPHARPRAPYVNTLRLLPLTRHGKRASSGECLCDGSHVNVALYPYGFTIEALTSGATSTVRFLVNGTVVKWERIWPYAISANDIDTFEPYVPPRSTMPLVFAAEVRGRTGAYTGRLSVRVLVVDSAVVMTRESRRVGVSRSRAVAHDARVPRAARSPRATSIPRASGSPRVPRLPRASPSALRISRHARSGTVRAERAGRIGRSASSAKLKGPRRDARDLKISASAARSNTRTNTGMRRRARRRGRTRASQFISQR